MGVIFYYSSQSTTPGIVVEEKEGLTLAFRKMAHAAEFGSLALLLRIAFGFLRRDPAYALSFAIAAAYAIGDEAHQRYTPERVGSVTDVFIDIGGVVAVLIVWRLAERRLAQRRAAKGKIG